MSTYPDVKSLVGVGTGRTERHELGPGIIDGYLEADISDHSFV